MFALGDRGTGFALSRRQAATVDVVGDGSVVRTIALADHPGVLALAVNDALDRVAVATDDALLLHDADRSPRTLAGGQNWPRRMAFADDGQLLQVQNKDGYIAVWDLMTGKKLGLHGPADDLGQIHRVTAQFSYWRDATLYVASLAGDLPQPREYMPCGQLCRIQAAMFDSDGAGVIWIADDGRTIQRATLDLHTGAVAPPASGTSRLADPYMHRVYPMIRNLEVRRGTTGAVLTLAVAADLKEWAATTPEAILDGSFMRPWAFAPMTACSTTSSRSCARRGPRGWSRRYCRAACRRPAR